MYYVIRIILIVVLLSAVFFVERQYFRKQTIKDKQYTKRKVKAISLSFRWSALSVCCLILFIPFEAPFIHFDSVEDSLSYKWINPKEVVVHYEDDCAFAVRGTYEIFAFDKDDKGFGFVNYHSSKQKYYASDASVDNHSIYNLYSVYQKTANKTFYLLDLGTDKYQEELFECDDLDFEYFAKINAGISSMNQVYAVNTSKPIQKILVRYDDRQKTFTTNRGLYITGTH